mgnify:CR=1 FL=1
MYSGIPETNYRMTGGIQRVPTQQEAMLQKQRNDMDFMNNAVENIGAGNASLLAPPPAAPAAPTASSGFSFENLMKMLGGGQFGGSKSTTATSGDTSLAQQEGDTLGSFTNFINELLRTAMGGKTAADANATKIGSDLIGSNTQAALANLGSKERVGRQDWVGNSFASLRPGFNPAAVPTANEVDTSLFTKGVPTDQLYGGGLGGADPLGVLGIPSNESSSDISRRLGSSRNVPTFKLPRGAMV